MCKRFSGFRTSHQSNLLTLFLGPLPCHLAPVPPRLEHETFAITPQRTEVDCSRGPVYYRCLSFIILSGTHLCLDHKVTVFTRLLRSEIVWSRGRDGESFTWRGTTPSSWKLFLPPVSGGFSGVTPSFPLRSSQDPLDSSTSYGSLI